MVVILDFVVVVVSVVVEAHNQFILPHQIDFSNGFSKFLQGLRYVSEGQDSKILGS